MIKKLKWTVCSVVSILSISLVSSNIFAATKVVDKKPIATPTVKINQPISIMKNATGTTQEQTTIRGYVPVQIRKAYGLDKITNQGAGQTIGIVVAYGSPTVKEDLAKFNKQFGLPCAKLQVVYPDGKPTESKEMWAVETAMDTQWTHVIAPKANLLVVVAKSDAIEDLVKANEYAIRLGAHVISNSWGSEEFEDARKYNSYFQRKDVVHVFSSGDYGKGPLWPASVPSVLSVGGTSLSLDTKGNVTGETVWPGTSGGVSLLETRPSYQDNLTNIVGDKRGVPDVSFVGDYSVGVAVYSSTPVHGYTGWFALGGTSLSTPCWTAILALANENRTEKLNTDELLNKLYQLYQNPVTYNENFRDITQGGNSLHSAQTGYDLVTGLGSPKLDHLVGILSK